MSLEEKSNSKFSIFQKTDLPSRILSIGWTFVLASILFEWTSLVYFKNTYANPTLTYTVLMPFIFKGIAMTTGLLGVVIGRYTQGTTLFFGAFIIPIILRASLLIFSLFTGLI